MTSAAVYELQPILDNPKFEGFGWGCRDSIRGKMNASDDFYPDTVLTKDRIWTMQRMAGIWKPRAVIGKVRPFNDYPCIGFLIPAFSRRASDALRDYLESNGELLPLISEGGEYFAYNVTTVVDILDYGKSTMTLYTGDPPGSVPLSIEHYELHIDRLDGLSIFRMLESSASTFVTDRFMHRVREHNLQGFDFIKLWPYPKGVNWRKPPKECITAERQALELHEGRPIKGNTVVIRLQLAGNEASKTEKARVATIMHELDDRLVTTKLDAPYYGSLEGDDYVSGECRLFLSCPDADKLARNLKLWLKKLAWPGEKWLLKRYGEYVDKDAPEKYVDLG